LSAALAARPFLVKPNRDEAHATLGLSPTGDTEQDARRAVDALLEAGAEWALVSLGAPGSLLGCREDRRCWRIASPHVNAVNPIGSGDSLAAGLLVRHVLRGLPVPDAVAYGTACAAANCLTWTSGVVRPQDVDALLPQVRVTAV
jgi:tagatose 6-phosphate kinase